MASTFEILSHIRRAVADIDESTPHSRILAQLKAVDVALNTLQLQQSPAFYLGHIAAGRVLIEDGLRLAPAMQPAASPPGESLEAQIRALRLTLSRIVEQLDEGRSVDEKGYMVRVTAWEAAYYTHNLDQAAGPAVSHTPSLTEGSLQSYLRRRMPEWPELAVTQFTPLDGGFSKRTILFETEDRLNGRQALVMRAEQTFDLLGYEGCDVTQEFFMIQLMKNAGLPIAEPLWLEADRAPLGCRFIISRKAEGRVYGGALGSAEALPATLVRSLLDTFIQMHRVRISPGDPLANKSHLKEWLPYVGSLRETTRYYVNEWLPGMIARTGIPASPQIVRALKWLQAHVPDSDETPVVLHGDFSFNNLIMDEAKISAVLDWESSRLGDPAEDIIWTQPNIGVYIDMPEFLKRYKAGTGRDISAQRLAYARVVKCVLNAVACLSAYHGLDTRPDASINLSILAYRYMGLFGAQFNALIEHAEQL